MKIVRIHAGLANQMLNYIFLRYMETFTDEKFYADYSFFDKHPDHNGFELDKIFPHIKLNAINLNDENVQYTEIKSKMLYVVDKVYNWYGPLPHLFTVSNEEIIRKKGKITNIAYYDNIMYIGNFFNYDYMKPIKEDIKKELEFLPLPDAQNQFYLQQIQSSLSVGVHVRRGDFLALPVNVPTQNYERKICELKEKLKKQGETPVFFLFTNDESWVKEHLSDHGFTSQDEVVVIEGNNVEAKNYIDMQLMSHCNYIIANWASTFSYMAGKLNENLIEYICVYKD